MDGEANAKLLVQVAVRTFYSTTSAVIIDQLVKKGAFRDDELARRVAMKTPDLRRGIQKLVDDQIVSQHRRAELREGAPKATQRLYLYMDYGHTLNVIKWRMWKLQEIIDSKSRNEIDSQGYVCPKCHKSFTTLDATDLFDPYRAGLYCDICSTEVEDNDNQEEVRANKDRMRRWVDQTGTIRELLKKLEDVGLKKFEVEKWLEVNGPPGTTTVSDSAVTINGVMQIQLAGDDDEEIEKAKKEAHARAKLTQNALPTWIAQSTVSGEATSLQKERDARLARQLAGTGDTSHGNPLSSPTRAQFDAVMPDLSADVDEDDEGMEELDLDEYYAGLGGGAKEEVEVDVKGEVKEEVLLESVKGEKAGSEDGFDAVEAVVGGQVGTDVVGGAPGSGKRSREDSMDGIEETNGEKRSRLDEPTTATPEPAAAVVQEGGDEDDDFDDDFDEVLGGDVDRNPLVKVGERMVPFQEVEADEELQNAMTADEYQAYWDIFQQLNG